MRFWTQVSDVWGFKLGISTDSDGKFSCISLAVHKISFKYLKTIQFCLGMIDIKIKRNLIKF